MLRDQVCKLNFVGKHANFVYTSHKSPQVQTCTSPITGAYSRARFLAMRALYWRQSCASACGSCLRNVNETRSPWTLVSRGISCVKRFWNAPFIWYADSDSFFQALGKRWWGCGCHIGCDAMECAFGYHLPILGSRCRRSSTTDGRQRPSVGTDRRSVG